MPDTKVQMNVTLTDGTVINAGQFTVPQGPAGADGTPGITPLQALKYAAGPPPVVGQTLQISGDEYFNRTPTVGEKVLLYVVSSGRYYFTYVSITSSTPPSYTVTYESVVEFGIGIKSVSVAEVIA